MEGVRGVADFWWEVREAIREVSSCPEALEELNRAEV
jgi:hypothetical protein